MYKSTQEYVEQYREHLSLEDIREINQHMETIRVAVEENNVNGLDAPLILLATKMHSKDDDNMKKYIRYALIMIREVYAIDKREIGLRLQSV